MAAIFESHSLTNPERHKKEVAVSQGLPTTPPPVRKNVPCHDPRIKLYLSALIVDVKKALNKHTSIPSVRHKGTMRYQDLIEGGAPLKWRLFRGIALECGWFAWQRPPIKKSPFRSGTGGGRAEARPYHNMPTPERSTPLTCRRFRQIAVECGWFAWQRPPIKKSPFRSGTGGGRAEARPYHKRPYHNKPTPDVHLLGGSLQPVRHIFTAPAG
jgi:hypothetical protein